MLNQEIASICLHQVKIGFSCGHVSFSLFLFTYNIYRRVEHFTRNWWSKIRRGIIILIGIYCYNDKKYSGGQKRRNNDVAIAQKLDLIEQNQYAFWIQCIKFVLNQMNNLSSQIFVDQCYQVTKVYFRAGYPFYE